MSKLSDKQKIDAIEMYMSGKSPREVGEAFGVSNTSIRSLLRVRNLKIRSYSEAFKRTQVNEDYFENIDSEEKAYFLGLLYADGSVSSKIGKTVINLKESDGYILERFKEAIGYTGKLGTWKKKLPRENQRVLGIYNKKIVEDLIRHGCTENKTFELDFPNNINQSLVLHFLRGFFDGDGCINIPKRGGGRVRISFTSTENMCNGIKIYLDSIGIEGSKVISPKKGKYSSDVIKFLTLERKEEIQKLMSSWYENTDLFLVRKYNIYKKAPF